MSKKPLWILPACLALILAVPALAETRPAVDDESLPALEQSPAPIALAAGCTTRCLGNYSTSPGGGAASHWGFGANCAAAQNDLDNQLWNAADLDCFNRGFDGACVVNPVITGACWWNPSHGSYQVDGYATYKCSVEICIDF